MMMHSNVNRNRRKKGPKEGRELEAVYNCVEIIIVIIRVHERVCTKKARETREA